MKKKILILLLILVGSLALFYIQYIQNDRTKKNVLPQKQEQSNLINASLKVRDSVYQVPVPAGSSVYDLMQAAEKTTNFRFHGKMFSGLGFFVDEINGIKQDGAKGEYWIYYINNQKAQVGVSSYIIKPNDTVTWKYEKNSD